MGPVIPFFPENSAHIANNWKNTGEDSDDSGIQTPTSRESKIQLTKPVNESYAGRRSDSYPSDSDASSSSKKMDEIDGPSNNSNKAPAKNFNERPEPAQRSIFDMSSELIGAVSKAAKEYHLGVLDAVTKMEGPVNLGSVTAIQNGGKFKEILDNDGTSQGKNIGGATLFKENVDHEIEMRGAKKSK